MRVVVFGTGHFGSAIRHLVEKNKHEVLSWSFRSGSILSFPKADFYISTLRAHGVASIGKDIAEHIGDTDILTMTKGFIPGETFSSLFPSSLFGKNVCTLSGPNIASEMLLGLPTGATVGGTEEQFKKVQSLLESQNFRLEYCPDFQMVEFMGIMKNIVAIGIGIIDGYSLGENTKGIFMAKMYRDIRRFSLDKLKKNFDITALFAGIGDTFTTCSSHESRNHVFGLHFAHTGSIEKVTEFMNTSIEGLGTVILLRDFVSPEYSILYNFLDFFQEDGKGLSHESFVKFLFE